MMFRAQILLPVLMSLAACATPQMGDIDGLTRPQERFLELAFAAEHGAFGNTRHREKLGIRREYRISIRGNQAAAYQRDIDRALAFYGAHFNIKRVAKDDPSANIVLFVEGATDGTVRDALVRQWNLVDEAVFDRSGWTVKRNRAGHVTGPTSHFRPYDAKNLPDDPHEASFCRTRYVYDDPDVHGRNGGGWASAGPGNPALEFPDYAIAYVFTGPTPDFARPLSADVQREFKHYRDFLPYCIFEEIGHALTFWGDAYSPLGEVPFNEGSYVNWDKTKEPRSAYVAREYKAQLDDIKEIFAMIRAYDLRDGMTREEVIARFRQGRP